MNAMGRAEQPDAQWYPDLVAAGDLAEALRRAVRDLGADSDLVLGGGRAVSAVVEGASPYRGSFLVVAGAGARRFDVTCWIDGVVMLDGSTGDLAEVAGAALAWRDGVPCEEIEQRYPFLTADEIADAHERGPQDPLSVRWRLLRRHWAQQGRFPETAAVLEIAFHVPQLRRLYPYTSHADVHFCTSTDFLAGRQLPYILPRPRERYYVRGPEPSTAIIGETRSATEALSLLLRHLQPGPFMVGPVGDRPS
jgi:hypothetical protein